MARFAVIRPRDDAAARQASDWCDDLCARFVAAGHAKVRDIDDLTPANPATVSAALRSSADLICYFGHGRDDAWLDGGSVLIDATAIVAAAGKAVISIACKTSRHLGPDAITAGVDGWLGFTVRVPAMSPHLNRDPCGEAIVDALAPLGSLNDTLQDARDRLSLNFDGLMTDFDTGGLKQHPAASLGYFAAMCLRDHVVVHGNQASQPLP